MTVNIVINDHLEEEKLLKPVEILKFIRSGYDTSDKQWPYGTVFRMYCYQKPSDTYFITCGLNETSAIMLWYQDDPPHNEGYMLSTINKRDLKEYCAHVRVKRIHATITIGLETGNGEE